MKATNTVITIGKINAITCISNVDIDNGANTAIPVTTAIVPTYIYIDYKKMMMIIMILIQSMLLLLLLPLLLSITIENSNNSVN